MKIFGFLIILASYSSISDIQEVYKGQKEDEVLAVLKMLESKSILTTDEQCYKAVF